MATETQTILLMLCVLCWLLTITLMMAHPMFRFARIGFRRSLRQKLDRWQPVVRQLGESLQSRNQRILFWLVRRWKQSPRWVRGGVKLAFQLTVMGLAWLFISKLFLVWTYILLFPGPDLMAKCILGLGRRRRRRPRQSASTRNALR